MPILVDYGNDLISSIALRIRQFLELEEILNATVMEVRQLLQADRVIIYRFNPDWNGVVTVESVNLSQWSILGRTIADPCFQESWIASYEQGRITAIGDIDTAKIRECYREFLAQFQVRANLVVPIIQEEKNEGNRLWGLLIVHQCSHPRQWKKSEQDLLLRLANQVAIAITQAELLREKEKVMIQLQENVRDILFSEETLQELNRELENKVKRGNAALWESEQRFRSLFESAPDFIYILDTGGIIQQVNPKVITDTGYSDGELVGHHLTEFFTPRSRENCQQEFSILFQEGFHRQEREFVCKDKRIITIDSSCSLVRNAEGEIAYILVLQRDISEKKQAEATLRENERRWRTLLENVRLIVVALDREGKIEYLNSFFLELVGYEVAEVLGKDWFELFVPQEKQPQVQQDFREMLRQDCSPCHQYPILTRSMQKRLIAWNHTVLRNGEGEAIGTMSIGEDITERHAMERIKDEFISVVSHELRTPLTSIHGALNLLATGLVDPGSERGDQVIQIAAKSAQRLVRLVNDILELERLSSGKIKLSSERVNVADLMEQAIAQIEVIANKAGVILEVSPRSLEFSADGDRIIQVLSNLLDNAIKFSPPGARIRLSAQLDREILFQVQDQGQGIPADKLQSIFERFHQVDASDSRQKGGTGLGLAICRSIIQQHGGQIWVESQLGLGSTFYFTVPRGE